MTLLSGGADPNSIEYGRSAMDHAVLGGNVDCVSLLVSHGAKLGVRPLGFAFMMRCAASVQVLV